MNREAVDKPLKVLVSGFDKRPVSCERGFDETINLKPDYLGPIGRINKIEIGRTIFGIKKCII